MAGVEIPQPAGLEMELTEHRGGEAGIGELLEQRRVGSARLVVQATAVAPGGTDGGQRHRAGEPGGQALPDPVQDEQVCRRTVEGVVEAVTAHLSSAPGAALRRILQQSGQQCRSPGQPGEDALLHLAGPLLFAGQ
jgi:hypothetical protein